MGEQKQFTFQQFDAELWLIGRLGQHGIHVADGVTSPADRKERIREALVQSGKSWMIHGSKPGSKKPETYSEAFTRLFSEKL